MDKLKLAERLGAHPYGAFWVKAIQLVGWGNALRLACLYEPGAPADPIPFQMALDDCRDIHWRVYAHLKPDEAGRLPPTSIVNIRLGTGDHRKPLHLLTDAFGLSALYGTLAVEKADES